MIFHYPMKILNNLPSGSQIRPIKMLKAFEEIGYKVEPIIGNYSERKAVIKEIKTKIENGTKYEFMYSESSTMPTMLTEASHLPKYPCVDFSFFSFCKKNKIKIGLFYRDIHWRFPHYKRKFSIKKLVTPLFYYYDLIKYKKLLDVMFLPSLQMQKALPIKQKCMFSDLPPATEKIEEIDMKMKHDKLNFIYVGGIGGMYNLSVPMKVLNKFESFEFNLCTRVNDWSEVKNKYADLENINIHHLEGKALSELYLKADIAILLSEATEYLTFTMPLKLFEYMSYGLPIIATSNTAFGNYIEENDIGWVIDCNEVKLDELLNRLANNKLEILQKSKNMKELISQNSWIDRANKVKIILTK